MTWGPPPVLLGGLVGYVFSALRPLLPNLLAAGLRTYPSTLTDGLLSS
jgi:hypothetical protein